MWFKKKNIKEAVFNKEAIMEELPKIVSKLYPKEVIEIHNEFNSAADKLLVEANDCLKEVAKQDVNKVNRLEALGFKQANQITELKPLMNKAKLSKEQIELLAYYQREYPLNKFITEEQVKTICYKYNLVCGDVDRFKGFVPNKNLKEIEFFKLKENDKEEWYCYGSSWNTIKNLKEIHNERDSYFNVARKAGDLNKYRKGNGKLKICAPVKDMDISGLELKDGYKLEKKFIPDPVVLQPVKGGYLILTAWGDEQCDSLVVNNKMN